MRAIAAAEGDEEIEKILARLLVAALDEAHVVDERKPPWRSLVGIEAVHRDVKRAPGRANHMPNSVVRFERRAIECPREERGSDRSRPVAEAQSDCVQALVLQHAVEELRDPWIGAGRDELIDGILHRGGDAAGADVEVAHEPPLHQRIGQGNGRVGKRGERDQEGNDEAKREAH